MNKHLVLLIIILLFSGFFKTTANGNHLNSHCALTQQSLEPEPVTVAQEVTNGFSIIAVPDTQYYSQDFPQIFANQTRWIVKKASDLNVVFVVQLGDLVNHWESLPQWENAAKSMNTLSENGIPWEVLPGNHDFLGDVRLVNYNAYFGIDNFNGESWFGGSYPIGTNNNNFALFSDGKDGYLIFSFQYHPSNLVLAWANETIAKYPKRKVIVATHDYLNPYGKRTAEGEHIWNSFVAPYANQVFLVLCGHKHGEAYRTDDVNGYKVHQLLADYQNRSNGGDGWLRILKFRPAKDEILVRTFSPYLNCYETDPDSKFSIDYNFTNLTPPSTLKPTPTPKPTLCPNSMSISESSYNFEAEPSEKLVALYAIGAAIGVFAIGLIFFMMMNKQQKSKSTLSKSICQDSAR